MSEQRLRLTRAQRIALFQGNPVKITFPANKPCPIEAGHVEVLSAHVKVEVTGTRRAKTGEHVLIYTLHNDRLGQRYLARHGDEHGYSHTGGSDVDSEAGETVDEFTQRKITQDARMRERQAAGELLAAAEDFRAALRERIEANPDFMKLAGRDVWLVRSKLDRLVNNAKRRAA